MTRDQHRSALDDIPTFAQLTGVWAGVVTQLWDIGASLWTAAAQQGYAEQPELQIWSTTVPFVRHPAVPVDVRLTIENVATGEQVPGHCVTIDPGSVEAGTGAPQIGVEVRFTTPPAGAAYRVTLAGYQDGQLVPGTEQSRIRCFGVIGA